MFKIIIFALTVVSMVAVTNVQAVYAHETEKNGNSAVTMHIEPDDKIVVGKAQTLEFFVYQTGFTPEDCNCEVRVKSDTKTIYSTKLKVQDDALVAPVTFPEPEHYTVEFVGLPADGATFEPIFASFHEDLEKPKPAVSTIDIIIYVTIMVATIGVIALLITRNKKN